MKELEEEIREKNEGKEKKNKMSNGFLFSPCFW